MEIPDVEKKLNFKLKKKPLLIGGKAMEYYGLRKSGFDVDFVLDKKDHERLRKILDKKGIKHLKGANTSNYKETPEFVDLYGDKGILIYEFELWTCIMKFNYDYLVQNAIEKDKYIIISLDKLLFLKALGMKEAKYLKDLKLIVEKIIKNQYK